MTRTLLFRLTLPITLTFAAACTGDGAETDATADASVNAAGIPELRFVASDFAFEGPATVEAGMKTMVLTNTAETWHHVQLIRLPEDMTYDAFLEGMANMQPGSPPPPWLEETGGVNPPPAGGEARVTMMLEAGEYAVLCLVDTPDGVPHVMKGMIQPLTVTPATRPAPPLPASDLTLTLVDYAFSFSEPLTAGRHVIRVENPSPQAHEVVLFRFLPGKTMDDLQVWSNGYQGPAPVTPVGGVPAIRPGLVANMDVTLTPGEYVALCFVPDATDGQIHLMHGMALPFTVS